MALCCPARSAYWCLAALVAAFQVLPPGYDGLDHTHRIVALADQVRAGAPSLLLADRETGSVLPTFVYYSLLPYLPSVALNLAGVPGFVALKLVAGVAWLVLAAGVAAVIDARPENPRQGHIAALPADRRQQGYVAAQPEDRRRQGYVTGILFLAANYVAGLWLMRMALAEIWVYALVPWVVVALLRGRRLLLLGLLLAQLCAHPVVFGQALAAALVVALALAWPRWRGLVRDGLPALLGALALSAPFWLPQVLWMDAILGTSDMPVSFADTFFAPIELLSPLHPQTLGPWLPAAVLLAMPLLAGRALPGRAWLLIAAFAAALAIQTKPLRPLAEWLPMLDQSLFVWRLMLPAAFVGLAALLLGWPQGRIAAKRMLAALAVASVVALAVMAAGVVPGSLGFWSAGMAGDAAARRKYVGNVGGWGIREFAPNYARLPDGCAVPPDQLREVAVADLRRGVRAAAPYLAVRGAPFGMVSYSANGQTLDPRACGDSLRLGPLPPGAEVRMAETTLDRLLLLRLAVIAAILGIVATAILRRRTAQPPAETQDTPAS